MENDDYVVTVVNWENITTTFTLDLTKVKMPVTIDHILKIREVTHEFEII